ncbi:MAG: hypothetical protein NZ942_00755 [Candidatus Aenigmarchaeota archaeon]|nr:hypothetical protein [Candidatus Aenigmarchaeota archaeon]
MFVLRKIKKGLQKSIIRLQEKWVNHILKYPYSFFYHASGLLYPDSYLCERCLESEKTLCILSSLFNPLWWIKYQGIEIEKVEKEGAKNIKVYCLDINGKIKGKEICELLGNSLSYSEVSVDDFPKIFTLELYQLTK